MERRAHQAVRLAGGRLMGFAEYGDPGGSAVLVFHREVGSRLLGRAFDEAARALGVRVVAPDRPGMGFSDFQPGRVIADWPADVVELTGQLGIDRFAAVGVSAGAAYVLACAWRVPERLTAAVLVGPGVPVSMTEHPPVLSRSAARAPWTIRPVMSLLGQLSRRSPQQAVERMAASAGEVDRPVLAGPEVRTMLAQSMAETFRSGSRGAAHDVRLATADWGLPLDRITAEVDLWHGAADTEVPPATARRLAEALPRCPVRLVPGGGHHLDLASAEVILGPLGEG